MLVDALVLTSAIVGAYLLRFEFRLTPLEVRSLLVQLLLVLVLQATLLSVHGAYRFVWRYVGLSEVRVFSQAFTFSALVLFALRFGLGEDFQLLRVPISIIIIDTVLAFGGSLGIRVLWRAIVEGEDRRRHASPFTAQRGSVLLIGAGRAGVMAVRELRGRRDAGAGVVGFLDDDPFKQGAIISGVKVLGRTEDLPRIVQELGVDQVIITIADISRNELRRIVEICQKVPVRARTIPGLYDILQGHVSISRFRDVDVEDLLDRDVLEAQDENLAGFLGGKTVMVTGAGGSIGSELCRQVARFRPRRLLLVERAEGALYQIDREMRRARPELALEPLVADVGDRARMRRIFADHHPQVVVHAAAHKHVPMMEFNPGEAVKNNVFGTRVLAEAAGEAGCGCFLLISTDKAVNPTSVMGASKRMAELVVQDVARRHGHTRYVAVRFGNVMGSAGSVIPLFREQIAAGGPVTVTHPDMTRYFMTIPEASVLVLEAAAMGKGGEIFVLDMGQPVKVLDLAKRLIELSGLRPFEDIPITYTGIRPGEKLFEELSFKAENMSKTRHPKIYIGKIAGLTPEAVRTGLGRLADIVENGTTDEIRARLDALLPEASLAVTNQKCTLELGVAPEPVQMPLPVARPRVLRDEVEPGQA